MASVVEQLMLHARDEVIAAKFRGVAAGITVGFKVATREVPVRTGALKASIKQRTSRSKKNGKMFGEVSAKTSYAWFAEYGNGKGYRGKPYLRPAFTAASDTANKVVIESIQKAIKQMEVS